LLIREKQEHTAEIARDAQNGHSVSFEVICCCANRHGILLALNSNLTSIFNRS